MPASSRSCDRKSTLSCDRKWTLTHVDNRTVEWNGNQISSRLHFLGGGRLYFWGREGGCIFWGGRLYFFPSWRFCSLLVNFSIFDSDEQIKSFWALLSRAPHKLNCFLLLSLGVLRIVFTEHNYSWIYDIIIGLQMGVGVGLFLCVTVWTDCCVHGSVFCSGQVQSASL